MDTCFPIVSEGDALVLALEQEDRTEGRPDELYEAAELRFHIDKMLYQITPREKQTLRLRFGMCKEGEKTLEQVGDILDVNRERARQIEAKALRRIRGHYLSKNLKQWACGVT
jgi:RNA polymerase sigma factor (sigma-70 family)